MKWVELSLPVNSIQVEEAASFLGRFGHGGVVVEEWQPDESGEQTFLVKAYLPYNRSYRATRLEIERGLQSLHLASGLSERFLKPEDWFDSLKKHFGILEIGDKFIIKPSWILQTLPPSTRNLIELDPGAAFGTGLHPTTRLCLLALERYLRSGMSVLDVGTGSGILSIAAARLGAASVLALDIDTVAVKVAKSNVASNRVDHIVQVKRGTLSARKVIQSKSSFDLALANITVKAISDLAANFASVLKPGGALIVSGISIQGLDEVLIKLAISKFDLVALEREGEWYVVIAKKENP